MKVMGKKLKSMRAATTIEIETKIYKKKKETKIYSHHKFQVKRFKISRGILNIF